MIIIAAQHPKYLRRHAPAPRPNEPQGGENEGGKGGKLGRGFGVGGLEVEDYVVVELDYIWWESYRIEVQSFALPFHG
jgi:hypothetical protein